MFQPCFTPYIPASVSDLAEVALPARPQRGADPMDHPGGNGGESAEAAAQLGDFKCHPGGTILGKHC